MTGGLAARGSTPCELDMCRVSSLLLLFSSYLARSSRTVCGRLPRRCRGSRCSPRRYSLRWSWFFRRGEKPRAFCVWAAVTRMGWVSSSVVWGLPFRLVSAVHPWPRRIFARNCVRAVVTRMPRDPFPIAMAELRAFLCLSASLALHYFLAARCCFLPILRWWLLLSPRRKLADPQCVGSCYANGARSSFFRAGSPYFLRSSSFISPAFCAKRAGGCHADAMDFPLRLLLLRALALVVRSPRPRQNPTDEAAAVSVSFPSFVRRVGARLRSPDARSPVLLAFFRRAW